MQRKNPLGNLLLLLALAVPPASAAPVTRDRVNALPEAGRAAWTAYLQASQAAAAAETAALQAELAANHLTEASRPPDGGDFKLNRKPGDPWFAGEEAKQLATVILSYQTPAGGWSKHLGFGRGPRRPGMQWTSQSEPGKPFHYPATFDNHSTTGEMNLLAGVFRATGRDDCKRGFIKGLNYVFAAQNPNGGWPQSYPLEGGYHDDITLNDDAMTHVLELLHDISANPRSYAFLDQAQRARAAAALAKGIDCAMRMQIALDGRKTVWCAQHDALTLRPSAARKMEPAALSGSESARLLKFLMTIPRPSPELAACIEAGLQWLDGARISDPSSTRERWARFYDLKTGKPVFPGRDGIIYQSFAGLAAHNEVGYDYYSSIPASIVGNGRKKWLKSIAKNAE